MKNSTSHLSRRIEAFLCATILLIGLVSCGRQSKQNNSNVSTNGSTYDAQGNTSLAENTESLTSDETSKTNSVSQTSSKKNSSKANTSVTKSDSLHQGDSTGKMPTANLNGYTFTIADCTRYGDYEIPEEGSSAQADGWWKMIGEIQKKLNCKIKYTFYDPVSATKTISTKLLSGEKVADILVAPQFNFGSYITAGFLRDLNTVPNLNLKASYWYQPIIKASTIHGKTYAIAGDYNNFAGKLCGFYYNKRLIKDLNLTDPYNLVKQNKWNFDTFRSMAIKATKDLNGDGKMTAKDQYGIVGSWIYDPLYAANNCRKLSVDTKGKVSLSVTTPKSIETLNWLHNLFYKDKAIMDIGATVNNMGDSNLWIKYFQQFTDGKALFLGCPAMDAQYIRDMEDDYGFVICPKGPNATTYSSFIEVNANMIGIFTTNKDLNKTGPVLEAMGYLGHYLSDSYINTDLHQMLMRGDAHSLEMLKLCLNNVVFDIGEFEAIDGLITTYRKLLRTSNVDFQAEFSAKSGNWNAEINKIFNR